MHSFQLNAHDMHERIPGTHLNGYSSYCGTKVSARVSAGRATGVSLMCVPVVYARTGSARIRQ